MKKKPLRMTFVHAFGRQMCLKSTMLFFQTSGLTLAIPSLLSHPGMNLPEGTGERHGCKMNNRLRVKPGHSESLEQ